MATVRVRSDVGPVSVEHPEAAGLRVALKPGQAYEHTDPIVKAYGWAFESDVESASAEPGEKRSVRTR
jgi:hypothetical protein